MEITLSGVVASPLTNSNDRPQVPGAEPALKLPFPTLNTGHSTSGSTSMTLVCACEVKARCLQRVLSKMKVEGIS